MNTGLINLKPPRVAQVLLVAAALLHWLVMPDLQLYANSLLAAVVFATGFYIMMVAWWLFKKAQTAICPTDQPSTLVVQAVYRITRNPMYLGMICMMLALALLFGSLPFYLVTVIYMLVMNSVFCPYEEKVLMQQFGDDFLRYKNRVRRWL